MTRVHFVRCSGNKKTGYIPVSTSEMDTCPSSCPLKNNGCYAGYRNLLNTWRKVSSGEKAISWDEFCNNIRRLPKNQLWRHNVAGDLPGKNEQINLQELFQLVEANRGRKGFTFTHKQVGLFGQKLVNARAIYAANKNGFTINLSANNLQQANEYVKLGVAPVAVVLPVDIQHKAFKTSKGNQVVICPAVTRKGDIQCSNCGLCAIPHRKAIIGFPAHGTRKKHVSNLVQLRKKC